MIDGQPALDALKKITSCPPLAEAEALKKLLTYLVNQTLERPGEPIREAQIAADVYGKTEGFDPRQDSTVRVQTSRLRAKLGEYYAGAGAADVWVLEVPKGSYGVSWKQREVVTEIPTMTVISEPRSPLPVWIYAAGGFVLGVVVTLAVVRLAQ